MSKGQQWSCSHARERRQTLERGTGGRLSRAAQMVQVDRVMPQERLLEQQVAKEIREVILDIVTAREETLELLKFSGEGCAGSGPDFVLLMEEITQDLDPEVFEVGKSARQPMVCGGIGGRMSLSKMIRCGVDRRLSPKVASRCEARRRLGSRGCRKKFCIACADSALRRMWLAWVHSRGRLRVKRRRPGWQLQGLCG